TACRAGGGGELRAAGRPDLARTAGREAQALAEPRGGCAQRAGPEAGAGIVGHRGRGPELDEGEVALLGLVAVSVAELIGSDAGAGIVGHRGRGPEQDEGEVALLGLVAVSVAELIGSDAGAGIDGIVGMGLRLDDGPGGAIPSMTFAVAL